MTVDLGRLGVALHHLIETAVSHPGAQAGLHSEVDQALGLALEPPANPFASATDTQVADAAIAGDAQAVAEWQARKAAAVSAAAAEDGAPQ